MRTVFLFGGFYLVAGSLLVGFELGHTQQSRALEGCEVVAAQVERDAEEAEGKAAACDELFRNLGAAFQENQEP